MLKYSACLCLINRINHVIWANQTLFVMIFFFIFWLSCHCLFHRSPLWTTDVSLLLPNGWWWSCQPPTSVSFPHAHRKSSPCLQVICISYLSHSMRILHSHVLCPCISKKFFKSGSQGRQSVVHRSSVLRMQLLHKHLCFSAKLYPQMCNVWWIYLIGVYLSIHFFCKVSL